MSYVRPVVVGVVTGVAVAEAACRVLTQAMSNADRVGRNAIGPDRVCVFMNEHCRLIGYPIAILIGCATGAAFKHVYDRMHPNKQVKD